MTESDRTRAQLSIADSFGLMVASFFVLLEGVEGAVRLGTHVDAKQEMILTTYDEVCEALADANKVPRPWEPEMSMAVEELEWLRGEYRELLSV